MKGFNPISEFLKSLQTIILICLYLCIVINPLKAELLNNDANQESLSCVSEIQLTIPQAGVAVIRPDMLLAGDYPDYGIFIVDIMGPLTDTVDCSHVGQSLMVSVIDTTDWNSCWSTVHIEDKIKPQLECETIDIPCFVDYSELGYEEFITVSDNCTANEDLDIIYTETITNLNCDPDNAAIVQRRWTVTDESGNQRSCDQIINLAKPELDEMEFPDDVTIYCPDNNIEPDVTGVPTVGGLPVDPFCEIVNWYSDTESEICDGSTLVRRTWNVMDWCSGETISGEQTISILDTLAPVITCSSDLTISTDEDQCSTSYTLEELAVTDECSDDDLITHSITVNGNPGFAPNDVVELILGNHTIRYYATDDCGNIDSCTYVITVIDDITPVLNCELVVGISMGNAESLTISYDIFDHDYIDNCAIADTMIRRVDDFCSNPDDLIYGDSITICCEDIPVNPLVEIQVTDFFGNVNSCIFELNVTETMAPHIDCRDNTIYLDDNGNGVVVVDSFYLNEFDNCAIESIVASPTTVDCSDVGETDIEIVITDTSGNTTECTATATVLDTFPPICMANDLTVELDEFGIGTFTAEQIDNGSTDNCPEIEISIDTTMVSCENIDNPLLVTLTVTDASGNSESCTAFVSAIDVTAPSCITQDITIDLDENGNASIDAGDVDNGSTDACSEIMFSVTPNTFTCDDIGDVVVTMTVTDDSNNSASCTATVTVQDVTPPTALCMDITVSLDENDMIDITADEIDAGSSDECGDVTLNVDPSSFDCDNLGDNLVTLTVTDESGNESQCTATVTVEDNNPPMAVCSDITVILDENGEITISPEDVDGGSTDGCDEELDLSISQSDFFCNDLGDQTVVLTVTDDSGNSDTCESIVTVQDTTSPVAVCMDLTIFVDENGMVSIDSNAVDAGSFDVCGPIVEVSNSPSEFDCEDLGSNDVVLTVTDISGNTGTCLANVEVLDTIFPICSVMDITVELDENGMAMITGEDVDLASSDNCDELIFTITPDQFDCDDFGDNDVMVEVSDASGNASSCSLVVTIVDASMPVLICPMDMTLECDADLSDLSIYGEATSTDNCDEDVDIVEEVLYDINVCGVGTITRTFTATDDSGNSSVCVQEIVINPPMNPIMEDDITWPSDTLNLNDCATIDPVLLDEFPVVDESEATCSLISIEYSDFSESGMCVCNDIIVRTWTVIDSCTLDEDTGAGIFMFEQILEVLDTSAPVVQLPDDFTISTTDTTCDVFIDLQAIVTDCDPNVEVTNDSPYSDNSGTDASGTYPEGTTTVVFTATDCCGFTTIDSVVITVIDDVPPLISCINEMTINVDQMNLALPADTFLNSAFDNCTDSVDLFIAFSPVDPNDTIIKIGCEELGITNHVVYVKDEFGNIDSCNVTVEATDTTDFCLGMLTSISGRAFTDKFIGISDVSISMTEKSLDAKTDEEGFYQFDDMISGNAYELFAFKNDDWENGLDIIDFDILFNHLLGIELIEDPYTLLAADCNNSGSITVHDLIWLRRILLGDYELEELEGYGPWYFIDANQDMENINDVLEHKFSESINIESFSGEYASYDFRGIKLLDLNGSVDASAKAKNASGKETLLLEHENLQVTKGIEFDVVIPLNKIPKSVNAFKLVIDLQDLELVDLDFGQFNNSNFRYWPKENKLNILLSKHDSGFEDLMKSGLKIQLKSKHSGNLSDVLRNCFDNETEILFQNGSIKTLRLGYTENLLPIFDVEIYPNPFKDRLSMVVNAFSDNNIGLSLLSSEGKLIFQESIQASIGENKIDINNDKFPYPGVYTLVITHENQRIIRRVIYIN